MANLFGNPSGAAAASAAPPPLVQIKAGKLNREGTLVTPDTRKGLVYLTQSEDGLLHFLWKDRKTGRVEDDLIIFPGEASLIRVTQCTTGRVYVLKFNSSSQRYFYWVQEPKEDSDKKLIDRINHLIDNPPMGIDDDSMAFLQPSENAQFEQLRAVLERIRVSDTPPPAANVDLSSVATPEIVGPILQDPQLSAVLFPALPPPEGSSRTPEQVQEAINDPGLKSNLNALAAIIGTGQVDSILETLGSHDERVAVLFRALQDAVNSMQE